MFRQMFDLMSDIFYYPLIWFLNILDVPDMDGAKGIYFAGFSVFMSYQFLIRPLRGSGSSDLARKVKTGLELVDAESAPKTENTVTIVPVSDD